MGGRPRIFHLTLRKTWSVPYSSVYFVAFFDRKTVRRIISLRKANKREFDHYEQETN